MEERPAKAAQFLAETIEKPPFSRDAALEAGFLIWRLQQWETLSMPHSRPMPSVGAGVHELRVRDGEHNWRLIYCCDELNVFVLMIFDKKTKQTPKHVIATCRKRISDFGL